MLCPRALGVLQRQLGLRRRLQLEGKVDHDHLFFRKSGQPIHNLQYPYVRWRRTLRRLAMRCRKPYCARHSFVSWNLMIGKNPLWVAKQHGDDAKDERLQMLCNILSAFVDLSWNADSVQMLGEHTSTDREGQPVSAIDRVDTSAQFELF